MKEMTECVKRSLLRDNKCCHSPAQITHANSTENLAYIYVPKVIRLKL